MSLSLSIWAVRKLTVISGYLVQTLAMSNPQLWRCIPKT